MIGLFPFIALSQLRSQQAIGADALLKTIHSKPAPDKPSIVELQANSYVTHSDAMMPNEAATRYVELVNEWTVSDPNQIDGSIRPLVEALPRPEVWPRIRDRLGHLPKGERMQKVRWLFDTLLGADADVLHYTDSVRPSGTDIQFQFRSEALDHIAFPIALRDHDAKRAYDIITREAKSPSFFFFDDVPDLVGIFDKDEAKRMLTVLLQNDQQPTTRFQGSETRILAAAVMKELVAGPNPPRWAAWPWTRQTIRQLAAGSDENVVRSDNSQIADDLQHGKLDEAAGDPGEVFDPTLFEALGQMLSKHPDGRRWDEYEVLGRRLGKLDQVKARLNAAIQRASSDYKRVLTTIRAELEARSGDTATAVTDLTAASQMQISPDGGDETLGDLERIAIATGNRQVLDKAAKNGYRGSNFVSGFLAQGRLADAQQYLIEYSGNPFNIGRERPVELPATLAELYYRAGRPDQVVQFLDTYHDWASDDLVDLLTTQDYSRQEGNGSNDCLGFYAAWGFAGMGRKALAVKVLHALLAYTHYQDDAFDLLNRLEGEGALSFYDNLICVDPYSAARPMAWKADLLRRLGRLKPAEALARSAVAKDPTDGSAPRRHRLMSYTILARVLRASGKAAEAARYEQVVKAVRIAEDGDAYRDAKLIPQALAKYREADSVFAGAYCIHARMAICLFSLGRYSEGTREYRKACELLPSNFGEVSDRCLGCDGLPDDPALKALQVAVLSGVVKRDPSKPISWFLLGQAYQDSSDSVRAAQAFRNAARLDPSYLSAWTAILNLDRGAVDDGTLKTVAEHVLRLNPRFPDYLALKYYGNYAEIWRVYHAAWRGLEQSPIRPLYPLHASPMAQPGGGLDWSGAVGPGSARLLRSPGSLLERIPAIGSL